MIITVIIIIVSDNARTRLHIIMWMTNDALAARQQVLRRNVYMRAEKLIDKCVHCIELMWHTPPDRCAAAVMLLKEHLSTCSHKRVDGVQHSSWRSAKHFGRRSSSNSSSIAIVFIISASARRDIATRQVSSSSCARHNVVPDIVSASPSVRHTHKTRHSPSHWARRNIRVHAVILG